MNVDNDIIWDVKLLKSLSCGHQLRVRVIYDTIKLIGCFWQLQNLRKNMLKIFLSQLKLIVCFDCINQAPGQTPVIYPTNIKQRSNRIRLLRWVIFDLIWIAHFKLFCITSSASKPIYRVLNRR
jgi:hypothetical protein